MRTLILTAASALCLLGCSTPEQQALNQQAEMERMIAQYGPACTKLGYEMNTDPWRDCILQTATRNGDNRARVSTSIFGSFGGWGRGSGIGIGIGLGR